MQSDNIYKNSYDELLKLNRKISTATEIEIDLDKLDLTTAGVIKQAIVEAVNNRLSELSSLIQGAE